MAGLDVHRFLSSDDPVERCLMQRIAARRLDLDFQRDERLAVLIANKVLERF